MSDRIIQVENLSKRYRIRHEQGQRYVALRDVLTDGFKRLFRVNGSPLPAREDFWALKDVSFEIKEGEVVGIIGRNGAGKSTVLKILSRITEPTAGRVTLRGRVASLLEVGTGFHNELTGRENIFLNGAILGMKRSEIKRKFDEIVAFAEVERFLDTPVKHYSSGMYVRLAFAVAAHLEPEILLVDEVLAVGDLEFQKKCLGKMKEVSEGGRTVVFVTHQMNQIRRLCEKVLWMDRGQVRELGPTSQVVGAYEAAMTSREDSPERTVNSHNVKARFLRWEMVEPQSEESNVLNSLGPIKVKFVLQVNRLLQLVHHGIGVYDMESRLMWGTATNLACLSPGTFEFVYQLPTLPLKPGPYFWKVSLYDDSGLVDLWDSVPDLLVTTEPMAHPRDEWAGFLNLPSQFRVYDGSGTALDPKLIRSLS
jgi:lipopolysaccharide transport system ATP-binding protein